MHVYMCGNDCVISECWCKHDKFILAGQGTIRIVVQWSHIYPVAILLSRRLITACVPPLDPDVGDVVVVALVDGAEANMGRVEIVWDGIMGTICDDEWDNNDATVVCRMLGYR